MNILLHNQHQNFESVILQNCSMTMLSIRDIIYITLTEDLKNQFVFLSVINNADKTFSFESFEQSFSIDIASLRKIKNVCSSPESVFVPKEEFSVKSNASIQQVLFPLALEANYTFQTDTITKMGLMHTYQIEKKMISGFTKEFHFYSLFLQSTQNKINKIYTVKNFTRVVITDSTTMLFIYQQHKFYSVHCFDIATHEDCVYHILHTLSLLNLSLEDTTIYLNYICTIDISEALENILTLYSNHVERENSPITFKYMLQQELKSIFFLAPLFEIALCEL